MTLTAEKKAKLTPLVGGGEEVTAIQVKPEEAAMRNDDRNEMLRSTPKNPEKFVRACKPCRQQNGANDHIADLERSAA